MASSAKSLVDQQHVEDGESYSEDVNGVGTWTLGTAPQDRYNDTVITQPTALAANTSGDPESASLRVGAEQFEGGVNLKNAFGSSIGNGDGQQSSTTEIMSMATVDPAAKRGATFNIENGIDSLGGSLDQVSTVSELGINWGGDLTNQQTSTAGDTQKGSEGPPTPPNFKTPTNTPNPQAEPETPGETSAGGTTSNFEEPWPISDLTEQELIDILNSGLEEPANSHPE
ncbi:MAG: hypothetical protein JKY95_16940, partial [Planctomycetaceae bacterium]|nr:hypothetical protein [Planctomycetaceae bacterium]